MQSFKQYFTENYSNAKLYRVLSLKELKDLLNGSWELTTADHVSRNDMRKGRGKMYYRSFFRNFNQASQNFINPRNQVCVEFDKLGLQNIRGAKFAPVDYFNQEDDEKLKRSENEDRLYSNIKELSLNPSKIINTIYIKDVSMKSKFAKNLQSKCEEMNIELKSFNNKGKSTGYRLNKALPL